MVNLKTNHDSQVVIILVESGMAMINKVRYSLKHRNLSSWKLLLLSSNNLLTVSGNSRPDLQGGQTSVTFIVWLWYKVDFKRGSGGATPRIFAIWRLEMAMLKNMQNVKKYMHIYTATFPQQFSKKKFWAGGAIGPLEIAYNKHVKYFSKISAAYCKWESFVMSFVKGFKHGLTK